MFYEPSLTWTDKGLLFEVENVINSSPLQGGFPVRYWCCYLKSFPWIQQTELISALFLVYTDRVPVKSNPDVTHSCPLFHARTKATLLFWNQSLDGQLEPLFQPPRLSFPRETGMCNHLIAGRHSPVLFFIIRNTPPVCHFTTAVPVLHTTL